MQKTLNAHKYPVTLDKNGDEALRQKILIQFHTDQGMRFANATKDLILRGSLRWSDTAENGVEFQTIWWDLPYGLEGGYLLELSSSAGVRANIVQLNWHFDVLAFSEPSLLFKTSSSRYIHLKIDNAN